MTTHGQSKENIDHYEFTFTVTGIDNNDPTKRLSNVFASLVQILQTQKVIDFTLTRTTLEQVFINFAKFQVGGDISGISREPG